MGAAAPIIIGISGASGDAYGVRLLEVLQSGGIRTAQETGLQPTLRNVAFLGDLAPVKAIGQR
jgi:hypothetical protein